MSFQTSPPETVADGVGYLLTWQGRRLAHRFARALEPLELGTRHFGLLNLIDARPGSTQHELGERSMIDPSSMVVVVDDLERRGLAQRRVHPADRRKRVVVLTDAGREMLRRAREVAERSVDATLAPLDPGERETLRRLLRKLAGAER